MILTVDEGFDGVLGCEYELSDEGTGLCGILLDCWEGCVGLCQKGEVVIAGGWGYELRFSLQGYQTSKVCAGVGVLLVMVESDVVLG
jgi:hypothetical protein